VDITAWLEVIRVFGLPIATLIALIIGGATGFYVWGWVYREMRSERDYYRRLALTGTAGLGQAVQVAEQMRRLDPTPRGEQIP
jgi:hypothetical protein